MADFDPVHDDTHRRIQGEIHSRINQRQDALREKAKADGWTPDKGSLPREGWLYEIKTGLYERKRMALLFKYEREGKLSTEWKMCAHDPSPPQKIRDPGLRCSMGVKTRKCQYLQALFGEPIPGADPELVDQLKADVCHAHVQQHVGASKHFFSDGGFMDDGSAALFNERIARSFGY